MCHSTADTEAGKQMRQVCVIENCYRACSGQPRNGNARSTLERRILVSVAIRMSNEEFPKKEMETLWAPWRVEYFEKEPRDHDFLETAGRASDDAEHLVITRRKNAFLMM